MKTIKLLALALAIVGQGLIAYAFYGLIPEVVPGNVRTLNFIVISLVYWLWVYHFIVPPINMDDKTKKQVSSLGVRWTAITFYSFAAVVFTIYCMYTAIDDVNSMPGFKAQLLIQCALLFLLLCGILISHAVSSHSAGVYQAEQVLRHEKASLKSALQQLLFTAEDVQGVPAEVKEQIKHIAAEARYITPSTSAESKMLDSEIVNSCDRLRAYLSDVEVNRNQIAALVSQLERDLTRRKKSF